MTNTKEFGSDFEYATNEEFLLKGSTASYFDNSNFTLFFSGRVALYHLLAQGIREHRWKHVFLPSFYCHEVIHFISSLDIKVSYYAFNPFVDSTDKKLFLEDIDCNVVVNVSFFGVAKLDVNYFKNATIIDDYTHDLSGIKESGADYCFGSLRKELPLPVGGFCFSPKNLKLPKAPSNSFADAIAVQKLTAMYLKSEYLKGNFSDKEFYRSLYSSAEEKFEHQTTNAGLPEVAKALLFKLDFEKILIQKKKNLKIALELLAPFTQVFKKDFMGFGLILLCDNQKQKNELKSMLIENAIFPATLWPNQLGKLDIDTEERMLFVHLDYRYNEQDALHIATTIQSFLKG